MNKKRKKTLAYLIIAAVVVIIIAAGPSLYDPVPPKDVQSNVFFEEKRVLIEMKIILDGKIIEFVGDEPPFMIKPRLLVNGSLTETLTFEPVTTGSNIQSMAGLTSNTYPPSWILFQDSGGSQPVRIPGPSEYQVQICNRGSTDRCSPFKVSVLPNFFELDDEIFHYAVFNITIDELMFFEYLPEEPDPSLIRLP